MDLLKDFNLQQKEAVTHREGPLVVIAGAGTGKTQVITKRIAHLIASKIAAPSEIIALTFTDKAADQMQERVDILVPYGFVDVWKDSHMNKEVPPINDQEAPGDAREKSIEILQKIINAELARFFEENKSKGREQLAHLLVNKVEHLIDELNERGYHLGRIEYSGDINYEKSEQLFSNGDEIGTGLIIEFIGFFVRCPGSSELHIFFTKVIQTLL